MLKRQRNSTSLIGIEGVVAFKGVLWALVHSTLNQFEFRAGCDVTRHHCEWQRQASNTKALARISGKGGQKRL